MQTMPFALFAHAWISTRVRNGRKVPGADFLRAMAELNPLELFVVRIERKRKEEKEKVACGGGRKGGNLQPALQSKRRTGGASSEEPKRPVLLLTGPPESRGALLCSGLASEDPGFK